VAGAARGPSAGGSAGFTARRAAAAAAQPERSPSPGLDLSFLAGYYAHEPSQARALLLLLLPRGDGARLAGPGFCPLSAGHRQPHPPPSR
jgi:hypothetical protein